MTFAALIAVVALAAQQPAKPSSDVVVALESARRALADGKVADAVQHATTALEFEPRSVEALAVLLEASKDDADARAQWAHELAAVACDAKGKLKLDKKVGAPLRGLSVDDLSRPGVVFQMGVPPCRVDILTQIDGVSFDDAWPRRVETKVGELTTLALGRADLVTNKRAADRPKDRADLAWLESHGPATES